MSPNVTISVTVTDLWGVSANPAADGSADHPYVITNAAGLDLLAQRVNGGEDYYGKYFKLMNDIAYPYATDWDAADSQENNFTRIGRGAKSFCGTFDGQGHTISGIRIYSSDLCQGLFGCINEGWASSAASTRAVSGMSPSLMPASRVNIMLPA